MNVPHEDIAHRTRLYLVDREISIETESLGFGHDGVVWQSDRNTAVKVFHRTENFRNELLCYERLRERNVRSIKGCTIPQLVDHDETLLVIEMHIVDPPYILDFGKAKLDHTPDYSPETIHDWNEQIVEWWGEDAEIVRSIVHILRYHGIFYADPRVGNIRLKPQREEH